MNNENSMQPNGLISEEYHDNGNGNGFPGDGNVGSFFIKLFLENGGASHTIMVGTTFFSFSLRSNPVMANILSPSRYCLAISSYLPDSIKLYPNLSFNAS